jgi:hypothetical protein
MCAGPRLGQLEPAPAQASTRNILENSTEKCQLVELNTFGYARDAPRSTSLLSSVQTGIKKATACITGEPALRVTPISQYCFPVHFYSCSTDFCVLECTGNCLLQVAS